MRFTPGTRLGPYEILGTLGAGGMGEVFRARDTRLGREVAVKVLPAEFAGEPERLARFEREAKLLASLNHPSIAAIYDLHEHEGVRFLAMELVAGESLAARLARGPIAMEEALDAARQIAEALEAAHEQGIVHRDLKPANIQLAPDGRVKVLDFGLAKALDPVASPDRAPTDSAHSPTVTSLGTVAGVILGTAAYMSPEQARGRPVDRRADIWAFGAILFEMLSGQRPFAGETVSDALAAVLKSDPDWDTLPADTHTNVRRLLQRCLAKDLRRRIRAAGDALLELDTADEATAPVGREIAARRGTSERVAWLLVLGMGVALALLTASRLGTAKPPADRTARMEIHYAAGERRVPIAPPAISPDGRSIVYGSSRPGSPGRLWLRRIDEFDAKPLPETEGATFPFWSPDSRSVAYFVAGSLRRIDVETGTSQVLCECAPWGRGGSWGQDGTILFAPNPNSGIHRIASSGGSDTALTEVDAKLVDASHRFPVWLPDGRHFLFTLWSNNPEVMKASGGIYLGSVRRGEPIRRVLPDASSSAYVEPGYVLVHRGGRLTAVPFDPRTLVARDEAVPIDAGVTFLPSAGVLAASASRRGDIAYAVGAGEGRVELVWSDRQGQIQPLGQSGPFGAPTLSPDGTRFAVERAEGTSSTQIWIGEIGRGALVPLTRGANDSYDPVWSPDGERIAFANRDSGNEDIYVQSVRGTTPRELLHRAETHDTTVTDWSVDGRYLLFTARPKTGAPRDEIRAYDFHDRQVRTLLADDFAQSEARLSPDGRWLAYTSEEAGTPQIYLRPYPALDRKWLISTHGGVAAHWRKDGRELWYLLPGAEGTRLMSVTLSPVGDSPSPSAPKEVLVVPPRIAGLAPDADHTRLLATREVAEEGTSAVRVILNWGSSLDRATR